MIALAIVLAAWLAADLLHSAWITVRQTRWERCEPRDPDGLRPGAQPYALGDGPIAVLCVHGFADTPAVFRPLAERLTSGGAIHCRAMRLPGAGEHPAAAARFTESDWIHAVTHEALELRRTHRQVWLVGHSLGGAVVLAAALRRAGLADGLCLLAPLLHVSPARSPVLPPRVWYRLGTSVFLLSRTFESAFSTEVTLADNASYMYHRDRFIPFATYRNLFTLLDWLRPRAAALDLPFYAAVAGDDRVVDTPFALRWLAASRASRRRIERLPDARHELPTGPYWKQVTAAMRSFMLES